MKYYFSLLLLAFLGLVSSNNHTNLDIAQVSGLLYENIDKQDIMLIFPQTNVNPSSIKHVIIKEEGSANVYPINLVCDYKKELYPNSFVKCKIDLLNVPKGFYRIILLICDNDFYKINNLLPFLIMGEEQPERPIELIDALGNITEYSSNQSISFLFSEKEVIPNLIYSMAILNNRKEQYNISLYCPYNYNNMTWIRCYGDFYRIRENNYKILSVYYAKTGDVFSPRDIYIRVNKKQEEDLKLINIRGYAYQGNSTLNLTFNKNVIGNLFSYFLLYERYNYYNLTRPIISQYGNNSVITASFDFSNIPIGAYHFITMYNGKEYNFSNLFINITNYNYTYNRWGLKNIIYSFIGGKSKQKSHLRLPKN